jgi:putative Ca2+/H+ antiporter (TMEM165/GDT1 family)
VFAALVMGSRYRPIFVFAGAAAAFTVHVALAVTAGGLLTLLPHRPVQAIAGAPFLAGAVLLWRQRTEEGDDDIADRAGNSSCRSRPWPSPWFSWRNSATSPRSSR